MNDIVENEMNYGNVIYSAINRLCKLSISPYINQTGGRKTFMHAVRTLEKILKPYITEKDAEDLAKINQQARKEIRKKDPKTRESAEDSVWYSASMDKLGILMCISKRAGFLPEERKKESEDDGY